MSVALVTVALILLSAFFVAVEFSLMAARRHRLEERATHSRSARAALRSSAELTLILAGAQLGITVCTLALGAVTKPAVHHALTPLFERTGMPFAVADVAAFVLALVIVTFLHLVIGEMAPKSWAISHPERSAIALALPMRAFMRVTRPALRALNGAANRMLRWRGIQPVDELSAGQDAAGLRHLVEHSVNVGALSPAFSVPFTTVLDLPRATIADLVSDEPVAWLPETGTVGDLQRLTRESGHLRIPLVRAGVTSGQAADGGGQGVERVAGARRGSPVAPGVSDVVGVVHVRDTLAIADLDAPIASLARPAFVVPPETSLHRALTQMRSTRHHLAVTSGPEGFTVVTITDVLTHLFPPLPTGTV